MSEKTHIIIEIVMTLLIIVLSLLLGRSCKGEETEPTIETKSDTIYVESTDTITIIKDSIRYKDRVVLDTLYFHDTILIKEQKLYEDEYSKVYISGVEPQIDSIFHYIPRDTIRINTTETVTYTKTKHWGQSVVVGVQLGYGVTINQTPTFSPYIGVGITYGFGYNF